MILYGYAREIALWVGKRTGVDDFGPCSAIGIVRDEKLIAGVVYSNFRNGNIEATIAADHPRWATRDNLRALFRFPFWQLGCRRITCIIEAGNERSLKLCQGLGFQIEGRCREVFGERDGIILGLLKKDCRWL